MIKYFIEPMHIKGTGANRRIICPICDQWVRRTLPPHMRKEHPKEWDEWCLEFVELFNKGYSPHRIMKTISAGGRPPFTWELIAKEIKRIAEKTNITLNIRSKKTKRWEPERFEIERSTVWQFEKRGDWASHRAEYRGNWSPQVPRNLLLHYTRKGDMVLDPFVGSGTTLIECRLLGRNCIGIDISPHSVNFTKQVMKEMTKEFMNTLNEKITGVDWDVIKGDARNLVFLRDSSFDLVCGQPPYADIIRYTYGVPGDLSHIHDVNIFCKEMESVAVELYRVLKKGKHCAILIGDIRRNKSVIPLGFNVMRSFRRAGFDLQEIIIKTQHGERLTKTFYWNSSQKELRFRLAHEYLFVFKKT